MAPTNPADGTAFDVDRVRRRLAGTRFADLRWVAETGSTNADLLGLAAQGEAEGIVLGADHQTAGRGRRGRTWTAPPGAAVLISVLTRPPAAVAELVMPAMALAGVEAVEQVCGVTPGIKWPNDLVVPVEGADRKLAGLLAEAAWPPGSNIASGWTPPGAGQRVTVVGGMGLNVLAVGRAPELEGRAVACDELVPPGRAVPTREDLVTAWLLRLDHWFSRVVADVVGRKGAVEGAPSGTRGADPSTDPGVGSDPSRSPLAAPGRHELWAAYRDRSATLGRPVRVDLGADDLEGRAVDVTSQGQLVVRTLEGQDRVLAVGDVTHLRPA